MIKLAVFGAGRIGYVHALNAAALPSVKLQYIVDPVPSAHLDDLAAKTGARIVDTDTVFADPSIDGVIIASSTDTHAELILKAVAGGKAMFCEKPISLNFKLVTEVAEAVAKAGTPCMIGFQRRYDPNFRLVRERIQSGASGQLEQLVMHTRDPSPPPVDYVRRSGGMFRDQAIHDFDMARYLLGEEIRTVYAVGGCLIDPEIGKAGDIDSGSVILTTKSGKIAQISNSRRATYGYDQRIEVHGSKGMVHAENLRATTVEVANAQGYCREPLLDFFMTRYTQAYANEIAAFIKALEAGKPMHPSGEDGLKALAMADAAMKSLKEGRQIEIAY